MRSAILRNTGEHIDVHHDVSIPPPMYGQVAVRIAFSGVCHSQLMEARGLRGKDAWLPHLMGHEGTGIVLTVGPGVDKVAAGDWVIVTWLACNGIEAGGATYETQEGPVNGGPACTLSDQVLVSENRLVQLPDGIPADVGVLFGCALPTGGGIVLNELHAAPGASLAIFGLGGVGLCALMTAVASEIFDHIIAVDVSDKKLQLAIELGATMSIKAQGDTVERIRNATNGEGVDFAIDASGKVEVIETAFDSVRRKGGLCVFASHPAADARIRIDPFELINGKQIRGSWGGACQPDRDIPRFAEMYISGRLPLEKLLTRHYRLENINEALADLEAGVALRPLVEMDP